MPEALALVETAEKRLWTPEGAKALTYLRGRGLLDETTRNARLGWTPEAWIPIEGGARYWQVSGIVVPWLDSGRLTLVKVRRLGSFKGAKYVEAFRDRPSIFPGPEAIRRGYPLIVTEGEFDALLLGQALGELAAVITLGSASGWPDSGILGMLVSTGSWYLAHDRDDAGDHAASGWPAVARRVRPPFGKDWTEVHQVGINLRRWWCDRLGGTEAPALWTWDELAKWRWGPADSDGEPGIIMQCTDRRTKVRFAGRTLT
jgi:hypothetical protein